MRGSSNREAAVAIARGLAMWHRQTSSPHEAPPCGQSPGAPKRRKAAGRRLLLGRPTHRSKMSTFASVTSPWTSRGSPASAMTSRTAVTCARGAAQASESRAGRGDEAG